MFRFEPALWASAIDFGGSLIIAASCLGATIALFRGLATKRARGMLSEGIVEGLGLILAGSLLRTLLIQTWSSIFFLVEMLILRTFLQLLFSWESARSH